MALQGASDKTGNSSLVLMEASSQGAIIQLKNPFSLLIFQSFFVLHFSFVLLSARAAEPFTLRATNAPARVVVVENPGAVSDFQPDAAIVQDLGLARLIHEVVQPLGPTLLQTPAVKSDVAFLESFASEMFARRGTFGWCGGWGGDAYGQTTIPASATAWAALNGVANAEIRRRTARSGSPSSA